MSFALISFQAIAIVLGFMVIVAFALIIFFAVKTRRKMDRYDKSNILWDKERIYDEQPPNVEEWVSVKEISGHPLFC